MQSDEDRSVNERDDVAAPAPDRRPRATRPGPPYFGRGRTAPRGADSSIGDDDTHRRLQEARNRASHSTEELIRRELGPEWVDPRD